MICGRVGWGWGDVRPSLSFLFVMLIHRLKRLFELLVPLDGFMLHCHYLLNATIRPSPPIDGANHESINLFICGPPRSGTTLLINSLIRHPEIAGFLDETNFFSCANPLRSRFLPLSRERSRQILLCSPTKGAAYSLLADAIRANTKKPVVAEKTPQHCFVLDRINREVPGARFIFIVRNPIDSVASMIANREFIPQGSSAAVATRYWLRSVRSLLDFNENHPDVVLLLKYEDLCLNSTSVAAQICRFLGISFYDLFVPQASKMAQVRHVYSGRKGFENINKPPVCVTSSPLHASLAGSDLAEVESLLLAGRILYEGL